MIGRRGKLALEETEICSKVWFKEILFDSTGDKIGYWFDKERDRFLDDYPGSVQHEHLEKQRHNLLSKRSLTIRYGIKVPSA